MRPWLGLVAALVGGVAAPVSAVDIKPGLWEVTAQTKLPGNLALPDPSRLPPQLSSFLEQKGIKLQGGSGGSVTARVCVTPDQAKRNELPQAPSGKCQTGKLNRSGDMISWDFNCQDGNRSVSGTGQGMLLTGQNYVGNTTMTLSDGRGSLNMTSDLSGRWLSAVCP